MAGHLMVYPYHVSETGAITYLGSEFLPDTKTAKVTRLQRSMRQQACCRGATQLFNVLRCDRLAPRVQFAGAQGLQTCVRWSAGARAEVSDSAMPTDYIGAHIARRRWHGCIYSWSLHSSCFLIVMKRFLHVLSLSGGRQGISHPLAILCIIEKRFLSILPGSHRPNQSIKPLLQEHAVTPKKNTNLLL
jgi:Phospholipase D C terminal